MKNVLLVSNGAGEDAIGKRIARALTTEGCKVDCFPLVGLGETYEPDFSVVGPRRQMPSGGLVRESFWLAVQDFFSGFIHLLIQQLTFLSQRAQSYDGLIVVGDLYPVILAWIVGCRGFVFVGTAKSSYHHQYSWPEVWVLKQAQCFCFVRDQKTADDLSSKGVLAQWCGNVMMDGLESSGIASEWDEDACVIAVFPGSREGAYQELPHQVKALERVYYEYPEIVPIVAVADSVDPHRLLTELGSEYTATWFDVESGLIGYILSPTGLRIWMGRRCLGDILHWSTIALGQAGTANEQAVGLGVPVIAYHPDPEGSLGWYRGRQKGLLGDSVQVVSDNTDDIAQAMMGLLDNPQEQDRRAKIGRSRMGPAGASEKIAHAISMWYRDNF